MDVKLSRCDGLRWLKAARGWRSPRQLEDVTVAFSRDGAESVISNMPSMVGSWSSGLAKPEGCVAHVP